MSHPPSQALVQRMRELLAPIDPLPTDVEPAFHPIEGVRAVLFDVYGTLFASGSGDVATSHAMDNQSALEQSLKACGCQGDLDRVAGRGLELLHELIQEDHENAHAYGRLHPEVEIRDIWAKVSLRLHAEGLLRALRPDTIERLSVEYECRANAVWPMPGLQDILRRLRDRGCPLGIVSNAQFYTPLLFEALLNQDVESLGFVPALCAWSWRVRQSKPAPAIFQPILAELADRHIRPDNAVFIGNDMLNDIWTANESGLRTVLFAGDRRSLRLRSDHPRCRSLQPSAVITALEQLPAVLPDVFGPPTTP